MRLQEIVKLYHKITSSAIYMVCALLAAQEGAIDVPGEHALLLCASTAGFPGTPGLAQRPSSSCFPAAQLTMAAPLVWLIPTSRGTPSSRT